MIEGLYSNQARQSFEILPKYWITSFAKIIQRLFMELKM